VNLGLVVEGARLLAFLLSQESSHHCFLPGIWVKEVLCADNIYRLLGRDRNWRTAPLKTPFLAGHQWLTPIILVTQEAEIRKIVVQSRPWANILQDPILKKTHQKKGWWSGSRCGP
jgi:hypothetical protein